VHQLASFWFYVDVGAFRVMNANKGVFYVFPIAAICCCGLLFGFGSDDAIASYWVVFTGVTFHHYQKQNLGIYTILVSRFHDVGVSGLERSLLVNAFWVGFLAHQNVFTRVLDPYMTELVIAGAVVQLIILVGYGVLLVQRARQHGRAHLRSAWPSYLLLLFFLTFYWPALLLDGGVAFMMFGGAHGLQYLLLMFLLSAGYGSSFSQRPGARRWLLAALSAGTFVASMVVLELSWQWGLELPLPASATDVFTQAEFSTFVYGWMSSIPLIHYAMDRRMWRFSMKDTREYMHSRLAVIF